MKKLLLFLIIPFLIFGQDLTYVPDDGFELLIETLIPNASNGINNDNYVYTAALEYPNADCLDECFDGVLIISNDLVAPIFDLTGIEDFKLRYLSIGPTYVSNIDLSGVEFVVTGGIGSTNLVIGVNEDLETIILPEDTHIDFIDINQAPSSWFPPPLNVIFNPNLSFSHLELSGNYFDSCELNLEGKVIPAFTGGYTDISINVDNLYSINFSGISELEYQTQIIIYNNPQQINLNNVSNIYVHR